MRNFESGLWVKTDIPNPAAPEAIGPQDAILYEAQNHKYPQAAYIFNCLVQVKVYRPLAVDGHSGGHYDGTGLIINEGLGLVLVSKDVVPHPFCTLNVLICGSIMVPGRVIFLHPVHNFGILCYDPSLVEPAVPRARLSTDEIKPGDTALFFRANSGANLELSPTFVAGIRTISCSPRAASGVTTASLESLTIDTSISSFASGSGLISLDGTVQALWMGRYCVSVATMVPILNKVEHDLTLTPTIKLLGAQLRTIEMGDAKAMGVPQGNYRHQSSDSAFNY